jgi:hypothetical protein
MCSLFLSCLLFSDEPLSVHVGEQCVFELPCSIPQEAHLRSDIYLQSLVYARPLPFPFFLESYTRFPNTLVIRGRFSEEGNHCICLGDVPWNDSSFPLPSFRVTSKKLPIQSFPFLLPYPQYDLQISAKNQEILKEVSLNNQKNGIWQSVRQNMLRHVSGFVFICILCVPVCVLMYNRRKKPVLPTSSLLSPQEMFRQIEQHRQTVPWSDLVGLLNVFAFPPSSRTAYELEEYFRKSGNKPLASAAKIIDEYGYQKKLNTEQFEAAKEFVKRYMEA